MRRFSADAGDDDRCVIVLRPAAELLEVPDDGIADRFGRRAGGLRGDQVLQTLQPVLLAGVVFDPRYRSVMFIGSGINPEEESYAAAAKRINFAPRIKAPKLLLQGRFDEDTPLQSHAEPLFRLLREPKRMQIYEGGHVPPPQVGIPTMMKWFDETLGPVGQ